MTQSERNQARWYEHYTEFLTHHIMVDEYVLYRIEKRVLIVFLDEVPSWEEINITLKQMNTNKAPRMDGITDEILKCGGDIIDLLEQVILNVWEIETPQEWRDAILVL